MLGTLSKMKTGLEDGGKEGVLLQFSIYMHMALITSRPRLWIVSVKRTVLDACCLSDIEANAIANTLMDSFMHGHRQIDLDSVLLPESHELIRERLFKLAELTACSSDGLAKPRRQLKRRKSCWTKILAEPRPMGPATVRMHMAAFEAAGRDWWRATIQTASNLKLFPGLAELTQRETEVLEIRGVSPLDVSKRQVFIVGKTLPWCRMPTDKAPCLSSNARVYLTHRRRLAIGVELLRCNGIYLREDDARFLMREVGNSVLVNLAGNSFEMCSFISVFCMLLTLRALCAKRSFDANLASLPSKKHWWGSIWSDDESSSSSDSDWC